MWLFALLVSQLLIPEVSRSPRWSLRPDSLLSGEDIVLSGAPGVWDGRHEALHGKRFGLLTDERLDATGLGFEARGVAGAAWRRYFGPTIHVRIYIPDLR